MREQRSLPRRRLLQGGVVLLGGMALSGLPACAAHIAPARTGSWQPDAAFLADLPRLMRACQVPGVAMAVVEAGELIWSQQIGVANAVTGAALTPASVFEAASLSKPVFAWLVLKLVDEKRIDLDQPLTQILRPDWLANDPNVELITAREVLRHSTGLVNWRSDPQKEKLQPAFRPGSQIRYSGEAYFWLQLVVEQITGASLQQLATRYLFEPAGMTDSTYAWDARFAERSVYGHAAPGLAALTELPIQTIRQQWQQVEPLAQAWQKPLAEWRYADAERAYAVVSKTAPAGLIASPGDLMANSAASLRCTVTDYARFMVVALQAQKDRQSGAQLSAASHQLMLTAQMESRPEWSAKTLGWNVERTLSGPVFYHGGNNGNMFKAFAIGEQRSGRALVVMTNGGGGSTVYQHIVRAATGHDLLAFEP